MREPAPHCGTMLACGSDSLLTGLLLAPSGFSQLDESLLKGMQYRLIGPFRGGRVFAVAGIPGDPKTYYFGAARAEFGRARWRAHWTPLFIRKASPRSAASQCAVRRQHPLCRQRRSLPARQHLLWRRRLQVNRAGKTWNNIGLRDTRHMPSVIIDPRNPEIVLSPPWGMLRPQHRARHLPHRRWRQDWTKVLYVDDNTGAID